MHIAKKTSARMWPSSGWSKSRRFAPSRWKKCWQAFTLTAPPVFWVQEEPANMGAWNFMKIQFGEKLFTRFPFTGIARPIAATPATGSAKRHKQEQSEIIQRAFGEK